MRPALPLSLSRLEREFLKHVARRPAGGWACPRATALLMLAAGRPPSEVAEIFRISRNTVTNWKWRWLRSGPTSILDRPRPGRPPQAGRSYLRKLLKAVRKDPRTLGYAFARWTAPRLAEYMARKTGVALSPEWVGDLLAMHGFVWRRTKRTIRNLPSRGAVRRARRALRRLKKGLSSPAWSTNSSSGTGFGSTSCRW